MATLTFEALDPEFRGVLRRGNSWSLCVGAGITLGMLPSWRNLAREVLIHALGVSLSDAEFVDYVNTSGWHFDAWMQTAFNGLQRRGRDEAAFAQLLEDVIYAQLRSKARAAGLEAVLATGLHHVDLLQKDEAQLLLSFLERECGSMTVMQLARSLRAAIKEQYSPRAVLTFNYDTLLETILRLIEIRDDPPSPGSSQPRAHFRRIDGPAPPSPEDRIPIFYLHGCLTPAPERIHPNRKVPFDSRDRVVAHESTYLQLARSTSAWAQTTFLFHAQHDTIVLVGHSLSDPNLRRWLRWSAESRARPPYAAALIADWLRTRPDTAAEAAILRESVMHLGTRIGWIDDWHQIELALNNLIGVHRVF